MLAVAGLGAFMSSTGMVAIFIPVVLMICRRMNLLPKRLMMPLSVAGLISGMMTLIAMAPNLMVNADLIKDTGTRLRSNYGLNVLAIERWKRFRPIYTMPLSTSEIHEKDILMIDIGRQDFNLTEFCQDHQLEPAEIKPQSFDEHAKSIGMAELTLVPGSAIIGKTTAEVAFRLRYGLNVVGIKRDGKVIDDSFTGTPYKLGDLILVVGDWKFIQQMRTQTKDFVVLQYPKEIDRVAPAQTQAPQALFSVLTMVLLMVSGLVPNVIAALIACLMLGYFRCIDAKSAYDSIHWPSLILIIGMMPFATALQKTGGIQLAVEGMLQLVGNWGLYLVLMMLFIFCRSGLVYFQHGYGDFSGADCHFIGRTTACFADSVCDGRRYCRVRRLYDPGFLACKYHGGRPWWLQI